MNGFRLLSFLCMLAPAWAQPSNVLTRIDSSPAGGGFYVDGTYYTGATTAVWPAYSRHTLFVPRDPQTLGQINVQAGFTGWTWKGGGFADNPLIVTADPAVTEYTAHFDVSYALTVDCSTGGGTVLFNGGAAACGQTYFPAGTRITVTATPGPGFVFGGWVAGPNQIIQSLTDVVTLNAPAQVTPIFQPARQMNLVAVPSGLHLLADEANVVTPYTAEWGYGSVHSVGPVSPQKDPVGNWWVFSSWSDGGPANHTVTVPSSSVPTTLTAAFVPGVPMGFYTSPAGLSLAVDGRSNWTSYSFIWGVGETHTVSAPAQQTDSQGRVWTFSAWSNGGTATQSVTVPDGLPGGVKFVATYQPLSQITVTSNPAGVGLQVDGAACPTPCTIQRPVGTTVQLSAPAMQPLNDSSRLVFQGWADGGSLNRTITATADPVTYNAAYRSQFRLALGAAPAAGASFGAAPAAADWFYDAGTPVAVTATAALGYRIVSWSGDLAGNTGAAAVMMDAPKSALLQLQPVPAIAPLGVQNAAGTPAGTAGVAPGSLISIFGANLSADIKIGPANPLVQALDNITVQVDDAMLPLIFVSPGQINAQLASGLSVGAHTLTVHSQGMPDATAAITVVRNAPALFNTNTSGAAIGSFQQSEGGAITTDAPAHAGDLVTVLGTGFGPDANPAPDGFVVDQNSGYTLVDPVAVIGPDGTQLTVVYAGRSAAGVGVDALQFQLPASLPSGPLMPLKIRVNGQDSNTVSLPIAN